MLLRGRGVYSIGMIAKYCSHLRKAIEGAGAGRGLTDMQRALTHEKYLMARLERRRLERKLLPADQIAVAWRGASEIIRARLLAVPRLVAPRLAICRTAAEAEKLIYDAIWNVLDQLSKLPEVDGQGEADEVDDIDETAGAIEEIDE